MTYFKCSAIGVLPLTDIFVTSFHISSNSPLSTVHTAADGAWTTFWNAITTYLPSGTELRQFKTVQLDSTNGKQAFSSETDHTIPGTGVAPDVSQNTAILVSLRTANASKAGRGRQYLPAPVSAATGPNGALTNTVRNAIDTAYGAMVTSINTTHSFVIVHGGFHRNADGTVEHRPLTSDAVTDVKVRDVLATQRRRTSSALVSYSTFKVL